MLFEESNQPPRLGFTAWTIIGSVAALAKNAATDEIMDVVNGHRRWISHTVTARGRAIRLRPEASIEFILERLHIDGQREQSVATSNSIEKLRQTSTLSFRFVLRCSSMNFCRQSPN